MNDCKNSSIKKDEFERNLLELTTKINKLEAIPILQTTCPILSGQELDRSPYFDLYMNTIRKVASDYEVPFIDHTSYWQEHSDSHFYWMSNAIHPNHEGHKAFA